MVSRAIGGGRGEVQISKPISCLYHYENASKHVGYIKVCLSIERMFKDAFFSSSFSLSLSLFVNNDADEFRHPVNEGTRKCGLDLSLSNRPQYLSSMFLALSKSVLLNKTQLGN